MDNTEFEKIVQERIALIQKVLRAKQTEYSGPADIFKNFKDAVGLSFHESKEAVLWEYMTKHLASIKRIVRIKESDSKINIPNMIIEEKIGDAINYLILLEAMLKEKTINN